MICPTCNGAMQITGFASTVDANGRRSCNAGFFPCPLCRGAGEISEVRMKHIEEGKKRRNERLAKGQTLYDAAKEQGMSPSELSELENGGAFYLGD